MEYQGKLKMSLVAQYDDLCRYTKVLTCGSEQEFKIFVDGQLKSIHKWKETESEVEKLLDKISRLEFENKRLETQIKLLKDLLTETTNKKKRAEAERNSLQRQILIIKEVLLADVVMDSQTKERLGFLNSSKQNTNSPTRLQPIEESAGNMLSDSDVDRTEDDLDERSVLDHKRHSKGKRSSSESKIAQKKKKIETIDEEPVINEYETSSVPKHKTLTVRCNSEPACSSPEIPIISHPVHKSDSAQLRNVRSEVGRYNPGSLLGTPLGRYSTGGKLSRQHAFVSRVLYRPEKCNPCRQSIAFFTQAFKCQDCAIICHSECKNQCPVPCIPLIHTPTEGATGTISDYTSSAAPMIPPLIVHCVNEIESRGLSEKGLYRVCGTDREVRVLRDKFLNGRTIPLLHKHDINAICGTIKEFLRSLSEPLITHTAWQEFAHAAALADNNQSLQAMYDVVGTLPQPNRDTLAFLMLHLQRVAGSPECKMPILSLAKIFGPSVIGYSVPDPADMNVLSETKDQFKIMEQLLSIPSDSWQNLLNIEPDVFSGNVMKTPENTPAPKGTRLGPLLPPGQKVKSASLKKTPVLGRNSRSNNLGKTASSSPYSK